MKREMKRVDRQVSDQEEIEDIIQRSSVLRLGMVDGDSPYVVPMNFGYENNTVYFHGALSGRKINIIKANPKVCLEFDIAHDLVTNEETACKWSQKYESVIAWGTAEIMSCPEEKRNAFNIIMGHYSKRKEWDYEDIIIERTHLIRVPLDQITAKRFL
ncbi:MAG: pyridoxamine 5'-phosphate oxidase family protein [Spirochaetales bacterium]|nr:pyridoxamine 5'-phosphate oxidase family protein [Spirochaetales bacterium]